MRLRPRVVAGLLVVGGLVAFKPVGDGVYRGVHGNSVDLCGGTLIEEPVHGPPVMLAPPGARGRVTPTPLAEGPYPDALDPPLSRDQSEAVRAIAAKDVMLADLAGADGYRVLKEIPWVPDVCGGINGARLEVELNRPANGTVSLPAVRYGGENDYERGFLRTTLIDVRRFSVSVDLRPRQVVQILPVDGDSTDPGGNKTYPPSGED